MIKPTYWERPSVEWATLLNAICGSGRSTNATAEFHYYARVRCVKTELQKDTDRLLHESAIVAKGVHIEHCGI